MSAIRTGICMLVAFAVLAHGGVEPWSEAVLEAGAAVLLLVWALKTATDPDLTLVWSPLFWPLLAVWVIGAVQWAAGIEHGSVSDAHRAAEILRADRPVFSVPAILPDARAVARICMVLADSGVCSFAVRDPAAFYVQRKIVLGARNALRRDALWPLREPQPFCRPDGIADSARRGHPGSGRGAARPDCRC